MAIMGIFLIMGHAGFISSTVWVLKDANGVSGFGLRDSLSLNPKPSSTPPFGVCNRLTLNAKPQTGLPILRSSKTSIPR